MLQKKDKVLLVLGLIIVSMIVLPYVFLGEGSYVQIHDQMDGEILNYIYQAKYLLEGNVIPEFMNGMDKASMLPPAPLGVIFYKLLPPFAAFASMHWICLMIGYLGMFFLCKHFPLRSEVCFVTACLFCYIPFYPVYGLAALGQPLLVYCFLRLVQEGKWRYLLGIVLYAGMSSLTLVGYVWVLLGYICAVVLLLKGRKGQAKGAFAATTVLTVVYLLLNLDLFAGLLGEGFTTHRQEMALNATKDLLGKAGELFFEGGSYSPVYSLCIFVAGVLFIVVSSVSIRRWKCANGGRTENVEAAGKKVYTCRNAVELLLLTLVIGVCLATLWGSQLVVNIRLGIGGMLTYFQADRIYWVFPFVWMLVLAWTLEGVLAWVKWKMPKPGRKAACAKVLAYGLCVLLVLTEGLQMLRDNTLNKNARLLLLEDYEQTTWQSFYMEETFKKIDAAIGQDKERYSVVSLGMYPSVALYNGYTCGDGYSNNYELEYKHAFRRMIAGELEKNPEAKAYFDDWGNRLYMAALPYGINGMVAKGSAPYEEVTFDASAMKELNVRYIFAAAPIDFAEEVEQDFVLIEGSPFSDAESLYEIWVYKIP